MDLLERKQKDYGTRNLETFGELGVLVRTTDKVERLRNLILSGQAPNNESVEDSWKDVIGYGILGLMLHRGEITSSLTSMPWLKKEDAGESPTDIIETDIQER